MKNPMCCNVPDGQIFATILFVGLLLALLWLLHWLNKQDDDQWPLG